jgi:hypothetical protein
VPSRSAKKQRHQERLNRGARAGRKNPNRLWQKRTCFEKMFPITPEAVASLIDPAKLRWIGFKLFALHAKSQGLK